MGILSALIVVYVSSLGFTAAQVCTDSGRLVGLDLEFGQFREIFPANATIILHEYGAINCYGVVTEWNFAKSIDCSSVYFQVWRPAGSDYLLVGQNYYDHTKESCSKFEINHPTKLRIPKHEQIPVQPDDVIGWTSTEENIMIKCTDGFRAQHMTEICDDATDGPINPGFNTANCLGRPSALKFDVSLQAIVVTGPAPVFANLPTIVQIPEESMFDDPVDYPDKCFDVKASIETNAKDPNSTTPPNALDVDLTFSFASPQLYFDITTEKNNENDFIGNTQPYTGRVTIIQKLDYENQQEHIIPIRVYGLGQYSESTLTVQVIHINEPHTITNLPDSTTVNAETAQAGDLVFKVEVFDDDAYPDPLTYAIDSTDILDPPPPFQMDNKTGILTVSESLYGMLLPAQYKLKLTAWDFMYEDVEQLTINLDNRRSNPMIQNLPYTIELPEDSPTGSDIYQIVAESRYPNELEYSIIGVLPFEMYNKFVIDPQSGWIKTTDSPDFNYGDKNQWPIYIEVEVCDDVGTDTEVLTINLEWINRPPIFIPDVYAVDIPEKCGGGSCQPNITYPWTVPGLILTVVHRDEAVLPDDGRPIDTASCSIVPSFASSMFIVEACRHLRVIKRIDVNNHPEYMTINLTLLVEDDYGLSDTADVYITVYDINDHVPTFNPNSYSATIPENIPGGMSILTVKASDHDFGENATFYYGLSNKNNYNGTFYFQIDPFTGVIYTKHPADYELLMAQHGDNVIRFHAWARDRGIPQLTGDSDVSVTIENVNDNRPVFECVRNRRKYYPVDPNYQCFYNKDIRSDTLVGSTILILNAYDAAPENLIPTYYLLNPMNHFALNTTIYHKGDLYTISAPLLVYYKYMMICMVEDQGQPLLTARPPAIVRVDTYPPEKHLVDITMDTLLGEFNQTDTIEAFMIDLYEYIEPWFPRLESLSGHSDRTVVTIYALTDASTFLYENLDASKNFVHVNDLLRKLRTNIYGDPRDSFKEAMNDTYGYDPVLVMPTIPNWWIHTLPGLITTSLLLFLLLLLLLIAAILLCRRFGLCCCCKKRRVRPTTHAWMKDKRYLNQSKEDIRTIQEDNKSTVSTDYDPKGDSDDDGVPFSYSDTGKSERNRPDSASTIHSRIFVLSPVQKD